MQNFGVRRIALLVREQMARRGQALDELDNATEFHDMESSEPVVEPLPAAGTVAEHSVAEPTLLPKNDLLSLELQALLDASVSALKDDTSGQNTQKVLLSVLTQTLRLAAMRAEATDAETQAAMLEVMERSAQFVEASVAIPQFNTQEASGVRTLVFNVYHRLAKVLGRNTPEAVKADTKAMLAAASDRISYKTPPGRKPKTYKPADVGELEGPELHIRDVIAPVLDEDMKPLAYSIGIYSEPMKKFYNVLAQWKSENRLKRA
ncbi:hypothetical protein [Hydrogenophaga sp. RWCD_12]|uniref:hypothetical protein n=1 Tax=Hydrogenophaga sp. RWCD_12 TaxID=3391190 RepID=UPI00398536CB